LNVTELRLQDSGCPSASLVFQVDGMQPSASADATVPVPLNLIRESSTL
jgi:hypothetical protein